MSELLEFAYLIIPIGALVLAVLPVFYLLFLKKFLSALMLLVFIILWAVVSVFVFINISIAFIKFESASIDASIVILFLSVIIGLALYMSILFNALRSPKVEEKVAEPI